MHVTTPEVYGNNRDISYENTPFNPLTPMLFQEVLVIFI